MNAKQLAARLNGCDFTDKIDQDLYQAAARAGLVVLYRGGLDIARLRGAINDYVTVDDDALYLDAAGVMPSFDDMDRSSEAPMRDWFDRKRLAVKIEAAGTSYRTAIPHEPFQMLDGGEPYCTGIVFAVSDLGGAA